MWKPFFIEDVFSQIQRGKRLIKSNQLDGMTPYISSTALNNGVDNFIGNDEKVRVFSDCITIANSGSVGASFYQPYEFIASDHVTSLRTKENLSQFESLFLTTLLSRLEETYSFNREINDVRIKRQKVLLPTDENGYVNFSYMEKYMKSLEMKKQVQILGYLIKDIT